MGLRVTRFHIHKNNKVKFHLKNLIRIKDKKVKVNVNTIL